MARAPWAYSNCCPAESVQRNHSKISSLILAVANRLGECLGLLVSMSDPADANVGGMDRPTQIHVYTDRLADAGECSELIQALHVNTDN